MEALQKYRRLHREKFGVDPVVIGLFWEAPGLFLKHLREAVESGHAYNELELLSDAELEDYRQGRFCV